MTIEILRRPTTRVRLTTLAAGQFGDMVQAVVDVERGVMAIGGELHSDEEAALIEDGSAQEHLWGINLYPAEQDDTWLEFDSLINVRPSQSNRSRNVEDGVVRDRIRKIVTGAGGRRWAGMTTHAARAAGRWATLSLAEQLANVGSEVDRTIVAWAAQRSDRFDRALARALELFDQTARDDRWRGHRRREILRAREEFCRLFFDDDVAVDASRTLRKYFLHFALLARRSA